MKSKSMLRRFLPRRKQPTKVFVIGLDCATPQLVFDQFRRDLPNLSQLMDQGTYGSLQSCIPAITVPAWTCMMSSKDPGQLGIYGFRNRKDFSYNGMRVADTSAIREPMVWDLLGRSDRQSILVGVPPSYPPKPIRGVRVGCFLTPTTDKPFTYPRALSKELTEKLDGYPVDVPDFRSDSVETVAEQTIAMTRKHVQAVRLLMTTRPWDFFMYVEIGIDRIQHALWKYMDPDHPKHVPGNPYESVIREYYQYVDAQIGAILENLDDQTVVWVVSDHGAQAMQGGVCFNEWLIRKGYLVLKERPERVTRFDESMIDWSQTRAWASGGYYGRLFLNVQGREPQGVIPQAEVDSFRANLADELRDIADEDGNVIGAKVFRAEKVYRSVERIPPDLLVYFGDLKWRSIGSVGYPSWTTMDNDTGPDGANHAEHGIFIHYDPSRSGAGRVPTMPIFNIGPSILRTYGIPKPDDWIGDPPEWLP